MRPNPKVGPAAAFYTACLGALLLAAVACRRFRLGELTFTDGLV
jgi:hypothetical protein